ncbi:MAG TPA: 3-methyladenine DNA glycosylase [Opitutae bacterium]|nr:3-methyladenine DNA glycosylase [Opitutae bacterium]|tara:strand:+ start:326 stop:850 length:525 start_codon:yes stop_codon:yes gene_type:complete
MQYTVLEADFFNRPTLKVARELLGKHLVCKDIKGEVRVARIVELESYDGFEDQASHAHRGQTPRNAVMFGPAGVWYVYLCYGVHWMLNIVTGPKDYPAAILIRGLEGVVGPGRLTRAYGIDKRFDCKPALPQSSLWLEDRGEPVPESGFERTPRIGVDYAGPVWARKPYRFVIK